MYESFSKITSLEFQPRPLESESLGMSDPRLDALFVECGGSAILNGVYRVHSSKSSNHWSQLVNKHFASFRGAIVPFGYDWLGRQYCILSNVENVIVMLDPSTVESFQLPGDLADFHNRDLVVDREDIVSELAFDRVLPLMGVGKIENSQCVGYKVPLFLGGKDSPENYEITDMEAYWETQCQIYHQVKDLPPGTRINTINFKKA